MTLVEKTELEEQIQKLKNCVVVYKNGKRKAVKTLDLPIKYDNRNMTIGEMIDLFENELETKQNQIDTLKNQIAKLYQLTVKLGKTMTEINKVNNVKTANLEEAINELGGNI